MDIGGIEQKLKEDAFKRKFKVFTNKRQDIIDRSMLLWFKFEN